MRAQEYLEQIQALQTRIDQKRTLVASLKDKARGLKGTDTEGIRVQSSKVGDSMQRMVDAYLDKEQELQDMILELEFAKTQIAEEIQSLDDNRFVSLLFKKYVENKTLLRISREMHYSYDHVKRLHGWALNDFEHKVLNKN